MKKKQFVNLINLPIIAMTLSAGTALAGTPAPMTSVVDTPDWLKVSGYAVGAYTYTDENASGSKIYANPGLAAFEGLSNSSFGDSDNDTFFDGGTPLDAVKVGFEATQGDFKAYASLFWSPDGDSEDTNAFGAGGDVGLLDAYVTYTSGCFSITGGKYISWLGYEAFDSVNMTQLTYANSGVGAIPGYHTGIKFEYTTDTVGAGVNVSDSLRGFDNTFWGGDEDYSNGLGYEGYVVYKGIDKLTLWGGIGFDETDDFDKFITYDLWASYDISDKLTVAAEVVYNEDDGGKEGTQGLLFLKYQFTEKFSTVFRAGFDTYEADSNADFDGYKLTVSPSYIVNDHFTLRAELSYGSTDFSTLGVDEGKTTSADVAYSLDKETDYLFAGVQGVLTF
jgi:hypothetical protein